MPGPICKYISTVPSFSSQLIFYFSWKASDKYPPYYTSLEYPWFSFSSQFFFPLFPLFRIFQMFILYSFYETAVTNYHSIGSWKQKKFILLQFLSLEFCNLCQQAHTLSEIMSIILLCHFQLLPVTVILGIPWLPVEWLQSLVLSSHDTLLLLEGHQFYWTRAHPNDLIWTWQHL